MALCLPVCTHQGFRITEKRVYAPHKHPASNAINACRLIPAGELPTPPTNLKNSQEAACAFVNLFIATTWLYAHTIARSVVHPTILCSQELFLLTQPHWDTSLPIRHDFRRAVCRLVSSISHNFHFIESLPHESLPPPLSPSSSLSLRHRR